MNTDYDCLRNTPVTRAVIMRFEDKLGGLKETTLNGKPTWDALHDLTNQWFNNLWRTYADAITYTTEP